MTDKERQIEQMAKDLRDYYEASYRKVYEVNYQAMYEDQNAEAMQKVLENAPCNVPRTGYRKVEESEQ